MVLTKTETIQYHTNNSSGEIIKKFQDCNKKKKNPKKKNPK